MLLIVTKTINVILRKLLKLTYRVQLKLQWSGQRCPDWYDHLIDQYVWSTSHWVERGVFNNFFVQMNARVLELCCGDGFYTSRFYAERAESIVAVDHNSTAIRHAKKYYRRSNIEFRCLDILLNFPKGSYQNIICDSALDYIPKDALEPLIVNIRLALGSKGLFSGSTVINQSDPSSLFHKERAFFGSAEDLKQFLEKFFKNVVVLTTRFPNRENLYFVASQKPITTLNKGLFV